MKRLILILVSFGLLTLGLGRKAETVPLYSISLTNAGDVAVANDVLIHFPNGASRTEVIDRVCARRGYSATLPNGDPNPQTKAQFVLATLKQFLNDELRASIKGDYQTTADSSTTTDATAKLP